MAVRPPVGTLFPYTTLFRSHRSPRWPGGYSHRRRQRAAGRAAAHRRLATDSSSRSEEHTSELQSRQYLVCRLLLDKKKVHERTITTNNATIQRTNVIDTLDV